LIIALLSGAIAVGSATISILGQRGNARFQAELQEVAGARQREIEKAEAIARYKEPLARAAYDLQSRIYNILELRLTETYLRGGDDRERAYVIENTVFLIAQYMSWTEIIRRDVQFIDLGEDHRTAELLRLQDDIFSIFQDDSQKCLRIFAGEQRALGEYLIVDDDRGPQCLGYGAFLSLMGDSPPTLFDYLMQDVGSLASGIRAARPRLVALQHALINLLAFLDPEFLRFSEDRRRKVEA
jgi:hypothetical protein